MQGTINPVSDYIVVERVMAEEVVNHRIGQDNPTNRFFLIANLLSIVALILAAVWIDRPKFFKAVSVMMVIVAILAIVQLVFPGQSAYARYSNAWAIINIIWAVLTVLYQKQQLQMKKHA